MPILASGSWKLDHLPLLAMKERGLRPFIEATVVPRGPVALTSDAPAPFTPLPAAQAKALELTLRVAHDFLQVLGVAGGGSLLRHLKTMVFLCISLCFSAFSRRF